MERNKADLAEAKIGVVGAGGVGGYLAAMLADAYPHVTVVARGKRGEAIRKQGLVLHSEHRDEKVSRRKRWQSLPGNFRIRTLFLSA